MAERNISFCSVYRIQSYRQTPPQITTLSRWRLKRLVGSKFKLSRDAKISDIVPAILSVYDKTGLLDLAKGLIKNDVRVLASGGTAKMIREANFPVE